MYRSAMISIFVLVSLCIPWLVVSASLLTKLSLSSGSGPASLAFDVRGEGPYTGITDGRILKYTGYKTGFLEFAHTSPYRRKTCDGRNQTSLNPPCGRPIGLEFYRRTGELYVADAFWGINVVGPKGGFARQLANSADGIPIRFADGLEVDQATGVVYVTDISSVYGPLEVGKILSTNDTTGKLVKYDPKTKKATVLKKRLAVPAGVTISKDGSFLLVSEFTRQRIQRYWLKGPKANKAEVFLKLMGSPAKIKRTSAGDFWVAVTVERNGKATLHGQRFDTYGRIKKTVTFTPEFNTDSLTEIHQHKNGLYLGSLDADFVGVYKWMYD